ncbi:MAG: CusA/CzcA family heavy metal efflux RND transporter [Acidobacteriota bacterium]
MISAAINWAIKNRYFVLILTGLFILAGVYVVIHTPVDAIPDLSDTEVIIYTKYSGQSPQVVEDQVTYPLTTAMLSVPKTTVVRGYSFFNFSLVYIIFKDGTNLYWARDRVLEYLNYVAPQLPHGVAPQLGPDATGVGWIYEYALKDTTGRYPLWKLRSLQDWYLRYGLQTVPGVSEVASVGGYVKQYQVELDPDKLADYHISLQQVKRAIKRSNSDVGGRVVEQAETEYMVRGLGYIKSLNDLRNIPIGLDPGGRPVLLSQVANIHLGPELRRGLADLNGKGDVAGGIVVMRFGENALKVIERVKAKLAELKKGLPPGVEIVPVYDRSGLIERSIDFLKHKLLEEILIISLVCILFLFHFRSALVAIILLPLGVLAALIIMYFQGLTSNIMSLGGIAIAMGAMVDSAIIMIENAHKHMEKGYDKSRHWELIAKASREVGPTLFWSLLVIAVSFLPIFALNQQSGRLFKPLAFTKTYAMGAAAFLAVVLVPVLMGFFIRGRIRTDTENPINRFLIKLYAPVVDWVTRHRVITLILAAALTISPAYPTLYNKAVNGLGKITGSSTLENAHIKDKLGSEFMPPLNEGDLLYMPTTLPGISITKAKQLLEQTDRIIKTFPEVKSVFGKIGRADTATDPAPLSMIETVIQLHQNKKYWRKVHVDRWYSSWAPRWLKKLLGVIWPEKKTITQQQLVDQLNKAIHFPGLVNAWTMPIKTRIDMLSTGIKTPVGIKILGPDLDELAKLADKVEAVVRTIPGTRSVIADRVMGGHYMDYVIDRRAAARYGLTVGDIDDVIESALGGMNVTQTVEGLERYPVNVRYMRGYRDNIQALKRVLIPTKTGAQIPITQVARFEIHKGPPAIKTENARKTAWIYVDLKTSDIGGYVARARKILDRKIKLPPQYNLVWSGQYEYMQEARARLMIAVPVAFIIILLFWILYFMGYHLSVAVWVGIIALAGVDAEMGVVMLLFLDLAYELWKRLDRLKTHGDLNQAIHHGAVKRLRPMMMTVAALIAGLLPILHGTGTGSQIMKRIAAPMVGGVVTAFLLELTVFPVLYFYLKGRRLKPVLDPTSTQEVHETD